VRFNSKDKKVSNNTDEALENLNQEKIEKVKTIEDREKQIEKLHSRSLRILGVGIALIILGIFFVLRIYEIYLTLNGSTLYQGLLTRDDDNDSLEEVQELMNEVANLYESSYVDEIDSSKIDEYIINALIYAYGDKYANYYDIADTEDKDTLKDSKVCGVGILMKAEYDDVETEYDQYILDVYDDSPAEKAGLKIGDIITKVNGNRFDKVKYTENEADYNIKGEAGTTVTLTIIDGETGEEKDVDIERAVTKTYTVRYKKATDDVGYIRIRGFESNTDEQFKEAIDYFTKQGINKFIFDLRNNSGGLSESAVSMLNYLIGDGVLMYETDNDGNIIKTTKADSENSLEFTSVTLINESTISAAEFFTQCLLDYGLTTTIGKTSYGKGTVCTTFPLSNGGSLMMSTGRYLTVSKQDIEGKGIEPDIPLELSREKQKIYYKLTLEEDDIIQRAIQELE
jgi:carboxyl-terminal processing protease